MVIYSSENCVCVGGGGQCRAETLNDLLCLTAVTGPIQDYESLLHTLTGVTLHQSDC